MGFFMIFMLTPWFQQIEIHPPGMIALRVVGGAIGVIGAPAALFILFGMAVFCVFEDGSSFGVKMLWFVLFLMTACFGAVVYFFMVYKRQVEETITS
jgi:hypothetical protein